MAVVYARFSAQSTLNIITEFSAGWKKESPEGYINLFKPLKKETP